MDDATPSQEVIMERLVLGYDGSPASVAALNWTAARCARASASVAIVTVVSPLTRDRETGIRHLSDAESLLLAWAPGLLVELHQPEGVMPDTLRAFADDADLVVVGINAGRPVRAAVAGWMPLRLAWDSPAPVCLIPGGWLQRDQPVTVGLAGGGSRAALAFASREAESTATDLRVVHAWLMPAPSVFGSNVLVISPEAALERHRAVLDDAVATLERDHPALAVSSELVRDSRSAALLKFDGESSMLVIGAHRGRAAGGGMWGSVAQEILWRAECPVCVVPD